jgi:hypothetical protein
MIVRFMDLPKKGCFAKLLKRPTETSDATVSVHGESVQDGCNVQKVLLKSWLSSLMVAFYGYNY